MEPVSIMAAASAVIGGVNAITQGLAANSAAQANAGYLDNYASNLEVQAAGESADVVRQGRQVLGQQRAAIAQSGTGFGGTNATLADQSTRDVYLDAMRARYQGYLDAEGARQQADITSWAGKQAKKSALIGGGLSILGGAGLYAGTNFSFGGGGTGAGTPTYSSLAQRGA